MAIPLERDVANWRSIVGYRRGETILRVMPHVLLLSVLSSSPHKRQLIYGCERGILRQVKSRISGAKCHYEQRDLNDNLNNKWPFDTIFKVTYRKPEVSP